MSKNNYDPVAQAEARLRAAEQVRQDLVTKLHRLVERGQEIADVVAPLGFRVHAENDAAARAELDKLSAEAIAHQAETKSLEAAIKQATDKMGAAHGVVAREQRRVEIKQQQKLSKQYRELGPFLDRSLEDLRKRLIALKANASAAIFVTFRCEPLLCGRVLRHAISTTAGTDGRSRTKGSPGRRGAGRDTS
jgi:hypothetical protein